jgi:hypothetical protein
MNGKIEPTLHFRNEGLDMRRNEGLDMPLVDSKRLAALQLGFDSSHLLSFLEAAIQGKGRGAIHACKTAIVNSLTVLMGHLTESEYSQIESTLHDIGFWHDDAETIGQESDEDPESARQIVRKVAHPHVERYLLLSKRAVEKEERLRAWYEVGFSFAEFSSHVAFASNNRLTITECFNDLKRATDQLPEDDRRIARPYIDSIGGGNSKIALLRSIAHRYADIHRDLSCRDQTPTTPTHPSDTSLLKTESNGLSHTPDYSICRLGDAEYHPVGIMKAVIHSMMALWDAEIYCPHWTTILDTARHLYADDSDMLNKLNMPRSTAENKLFLTSGLWKTLVIGYTEHGGQRKTYCFVMPKPQKP